MRNDRSPHPAKSPSSILQKVHMRSSPVTTLLLCSRSSEESFSSASAPALDVFSLGQTMRYVLTGVHPMDTFLTAWLFSQCPALCMPRRRVVRDTSLSPNAYDFIHKLRHPIAKERIRAQEALEHPWVCEVTSST